MGKSRKERGRMKMNGGGQKKRDSGRVGVGG